MQTLQVNEAFLAQTSRILLAGVAGRSIAIRGMQLTIDPGPGNGALSLRNGAAGTIFRMGNPPDPSVLSMLPRPKSHPQDHYFVLGAGKNLELIWSFAGVGSVVGIINYDWVASVTAANTANA